MDLAVPWLLFGALLLTGSFGVGLLIERAAGYRLPGPLLAGLGFTGMVGATQLVTRPGVSSALAPAVVVVLAVAGYALSWSRRRERRLDRWAIALVVVVGVTFAAPALLTGEPTFLGYQDLGDAAIHFELTDRWLSDGPSVAGLDPSSYQQSLKGYFDTAYPTGAHTVLGAVGALTGTDVAWLFQPYLVFLAVLIALGLYHLAASATRRRWLAAAIAALAVQAALVYSYATNQQALKELAALVCIVTAAGLVTPLVRARPGWRAGIPAAVAVGGGLGVLNLAVAPWVGPLMVLALIGLWRRGPEHRRAVLAEAGVFAVIAGALAIPALVKLNSFVSVSNDALVAQEEFGNLGRRLDFVQSLGVWPVADFRLPMPPDLGFAYVLIGAFALAAVLGLVTAIRKEAWPVVLFAAVSLLGFLVVAGRASPWAYAKALMLLSPAVVLLAGVTVAGWWDSSRRVEAAVVGALLITGIVWTNAQTYHGVSAAPHDRMAELDRINDKFAGRGPAFYFESEEFAKYFLRDLAPTGATEAYSPGQATAILPIRFGYDSDADDWSPKSLAEHFKLLVVRRGPTASRPSSAYRRVWSGRWYDVWELDPAAPPVLAAMPLGTRLDAAEDIPCSTRFERLAQTAADAGGRLTYVPRDKTVAFRVTRSRTPDEWFIDPGDDETWRPEGQGRLEQSVRVDTAGTYTAWLEASVGREATLYVDDQRVGSLKNHLNPRGSSTQVGTVTLEPGLHRFRLDLAGGSPDPRNGGRNRLIGPAYLTTQANPSDGALRTVEPGQWRSLCGEHADWVQATGPA